MDIKYEWIIKEVVWAQQSRPPTPGNVLVYDEAGEHAVIMSWDIETEQLHFNGEYCDVGDDLTEYIAVMDLATESFPEKVRLEKQPHS
jgi:hypothetical protein